MGHGYISHKEVLRGHSMKPRKWHLSSNEDPRILEMPEWWVSVITHYESIMPVWNGASLHPRKAMSASDDETKSVVLTENFGGQKIRLQAPDAGHGAARFDVLRAEF